MIDLDAPVSTRYSTPVFSSFMVKVEYEGQAATVLGSLSTRFLTRHRVGDKSMLWHQIAGGKHIMNLGAGTVV